MDMASLGEYLGAMNKLQIHPPNLTYLAVVMWWKGSGEGSIIHAPDTPGASGIKIEPGAADFITAYEAITVVTCIHAMQCAVDSL